MYNTLILYIQGRGYFKMFTNDEVINFLESSHPECEYLDYKRKGYQKGQRGNFIKDIISMLNTYNAYDRNRFIIIGVDDSGHLFGISESEKRDDNEYQNWVDKIYPVPTINTGHVIYKNMIFEVICVNKENDGQVYEVAKGVSEPPAYEGQSFYRQGSRNTLLTEDDKRKIRASYFDASKYKEKLIELVDNYVGNGVPPILIALMIEAWDFNYKGDEEFITQLTDKTIEEFKREVQVFHRGEKGFIKIKGQRGQFKNRNNLLGFIAEKFYDHYWDSIETNIKKVINSIGANLSKPKNQRWYIVPGEESLYSKGFLSGLYDFIAYLSVNKKIFTSCEVQRLRNLQYECIHTIFKNSDWRTLATLEEYMDSIIEWEPNIFLNCSNDCLSHDDKIFRDLLNEEIEGIIPINYGEHWCQGLQKLAYLNEFFNSSLNILFRLSKIQPKITQYIIMSLLPWNPLTQANITTRYNIVRNFLRDDFELGWKIAIQLLPNKIQSGQYLEGLKYRGPIDRVDVSKAEYIDISKQYFDLLINYIKMPEYNYKLSSLLDEFWLYFPNMQKTLLSLVRTFIDSNHLISFDLYLNLVKVLEMYNLNHRTDNVYDKETAECLKEIIRDIEKININYNEKLLFLNNRTFLYSGIEEYVKRQKVVEELQRKIVYEKISKNKLVDFINDIEDKATLGNIISTMLKSNDEFIGYLTTFRQQNLDLFNGFITGVCKIHPEYICQYIQNYSPDGVTINALLISDLIYSALINQKWITSKDFLKAINVYRLQLNDENNKQKFIKTFIYYGLYDKALLMMYYYHYDMKLDPEDLMQSLEKLEWNANLAVSGAEIKKLILYCEDYIDNSKRLGFIECKYIELFEYDNECQLSSLNNLLYDNLSLFFECICYAYKAESDKDKMILLTSEEKELARKSYSILYKWIKLESKIDSGDTFENWFNCVIWHANRVDRLNIVLEILGSKLFHVKSNEICGFLSTEVVKILENPNLEFLHRGYVIEAFNSRGVYWYSEDDDKERYDDYYKKFLLLSEAGYIYTSNLYKKIAEDVQRDNNIWSI